MTLDRQDVRVQLLEVSVFGDVTGLAAAAATLTAETIASRVNERGSARVIFATGNSQLAFVEALRHQPGLPWDHVTVFHMDEYLGMSDTHPASFRRWIRERIEAPFKPADVHYLNGDAADPETECKRYEALLREEPIDLVCLGIGENAHIAFNEPHQADFRDTRWVRVVQIDPQTRSQQVDEGHFPSLDETPRGAMTLTVPALLSANSVQAVVPERRKARAVLQALTDPISPACPATVLRTHPDAVLMLDNESAHLFSAATADTTA